MVLQFCKSALLALVLGAGLRWCCYLVLLPEAGGRHRAPGLAALPPALVLSRPSRSAARPAQLAAPTPALMLGNFFYYIVVHGGMLKLPKNQCSLFAILTC